MLASASPPIRSAGRGLCALSHMDRIRCPLRRSCGRAVRSSCRVGAGGHHRASVGDDRRVCARRERRVRRRTLFLTDGGPLAWGFGSAGRQQQHQRRAGGGGGGRSRQRGRWAMVVHSKGGGGREAGARHRTSPLITRVGPPPAIPARTRHAHRRPKAARSRPPHAAPRAASSNWSLPRALGWRLGLRRPTEQNLPQQRRRAPLRADPPPRRVHTPLTQPKPPLSLHTHPTTQTPPPHSFHHQP